MLPLLEFAAARLGHKVQSVGGLGGECVDLVELWAAQLGKRPLAGNAVDLYALADAEAWLRTPNGPTNAPPAGAIVVWHPSQTVGIGAAGHTAIALVADANWLVSLDQNWPTHAPVSLVLHTYAGITGWLIARETPSP